MHHSRNKSSESHIISFLPYPYQSLDKDGIILTVNEKWLSRMGYKKKEVMGRFFGDFLPVSQQKKFLDNFERFKRTGKAECIEFQLQKKDGSLIDLSFCGQVQYDKDGTFLRSHCIWHDITKEKQAETALEENERKFRGLIENTSDWVWETDDRGIYTYVSPNVEEIMGYAPEEVVGKTPFDFMSKKEAGRVKKIVEKIIAKSQPIHGLNDKMITRDGQEIIFETNANPLFSADGGLKGYFGTCRDITEMKKSREQDLKTTERLEALVEIYQAEDMSEDKIGTYVLDAAIKLTDSEMGFINFMNEDSGYTKQYSYSKNTMKKCQTQIPEHFPLKNAGLWAHSVKKRRPVIINDYNVTHPEKKGVPSGHVFVRRFMTVPVFDQGRIVMIAAVANKASDYSETDVNQLILLMEGLWKHIKEKEIYHQLKSSLDEKDILLKEIHHRVKNNMQVIISLLKLQAAHFKNPKLNQALQESSNRIQTMALIHTQLYQSENLSRIDFRQYIPKICSLLMTLYHVDRSRIRCRYQIGEVSLKLEYALSCALIFNELISNSLKYAFPDKEKGDIMIRMENYQEDNVILEISDNGSGLPEEIDWRKTKSLGLKIVKLLGEGQLGGRIVYSGGERTTFTLIFPKSKDE